MQDASNDAADAASEWTTYKHCVHRPDPDIDGYEIRITGWDNSFHIKKEQLAHIGQSLEEYLDWLLSSYEARVVQ